MSGRLKRDEQIDEEPELTAQPKTLEDELGTIEEHEPGLSVDADELGRNFLSDAMEQGNFESEIRGDGADPSDEALTGPNFEPDHDVWENTISLSLQNGTLGESEPLVEDSDDEDDRRLDEADGLDLTENAIHSGSLLDSETDELGVTREPEVRTDDTHTHGKPRGGRSKLRTGGPSKSPTAAARKKADPVSRGR